MAAFIIAIGFVVVSIVLTVKLYDSTKKDKDDPS